MHMRNRLFHTLLPFLFVVALIAVHSATAQAASDADHAAVQEASGRYYAALNSMFAGDPTPLEEVWWHTDDVVYMGTDGTYTVGWTEIYANWEKKASRHLGGHAKTEDLRMTVVGDMAVTNEYIVADYSSDGQPREVKPRATSVFQKKDGQWKMISHHVDVIPALEE
jgi:ketosteroid isomerase-like protein